MENMISTKGFTLLEIMIVVVIIGILASFIVPRLVDRPDQARLVKVKHDLLTLESGLELYKLDNGVYPTSRQGLNALVNKPTTSPIPKHWKKRVYIKKLKKDPWGNNYQYRYPGKHGDFDLYSYGADGKTGGDDLNQDIGNWNIDNDHSE